MFSKYIGEDHRRLAHGKAESAIDFRSYLMAFLAFVWMKGNGLLLMYYKILIVNKILDQTQVKPVDGFPRG